MTSGPQGGDYAGPWFPALTAQPVPPPPPPPVHAPVAESVDLRTPVWLENAAEPEPEPVAAAVPRRPRRRWVMPGAATMLVVAGLFGAGAVAVYSGGSDNAVTTSLAEPALGTVQDMAPADWCPAMKSADRIVGAEKGELTTGPGLIMWLMHAYFIERDPAAVRSAFAPGAVVATAEETRKAVDGVVPGTKYCVEIRVVADNLFRVNVEQLKPDGSAVSSTDEMVITNVGGRPMISVIRPGDD